MSGAIRLTLCAAAASLMAACALLPLVSSVSWLVQAAVVVAASAGAGALARRAPLPRPVTVAAQAAVVLLVLSWLFVRDAAVLGVLPGPAAVERFAGLLGEGAKDIGEYAVPAPATPGIRLMLVGGVALVALCVDALAVTYRSAAPAGLPMLALYSVAAGLSGDGSGWQWFALAAGGYLLLLLAEGRDRLSRWGRVFGGSGGGPRAAEPDRPPAPVRTGRRIGAVALGIALIVPVADLTGPGLLGERTGDGGSGGGGGTISAVNPLVSLQDSLNRPEDREVLRYRTTAPGGSGLYLRFVSLDKFDGTAWKPSERRVQDVPEPRRWPLPAGLATDVPVTPVSTVLSTAEWYRQNWLPLPYPVTGVEIEGRWRFEPEGRTLVGDRRQTTAGARYTVTSLQVEPTAEQLRNAPRPPADLLEEYTRVPDSLPGEVAEQARRVTAGASDDYERARRLQDWFASSGGFRYDTEVESGTGSTAITRFLRNKEGFCVHFAFSMAAMARTLDVPARVAVGYTPGVRDANGTWSVGLQDAHAWPELYFEGIGWTRFEPTPDRGSVPEYARQEAPEPEVAEPEAPRNPAAAPSTDTGDRRKCNDPDSTDPACGGPVASADVPQDPGVFTARTALVTAASAVLAALLALPMLWRIRVRARRLGGGRTGGADRARAAARGTGPAPAGSAVAGPAGGRPDGQADGRSAAERGRSLAAWRELSDTAWDYGITPDPSETPRRAGARIVRAGGLEGPAADSVMRVAGAVEQAVYAPRPRPAAGLGDDVRRVGATLRASAGRRAALRALLLPRSAARMGWAVSAAWERTLVRWSAATRRLTGALPRPRSGKRT
ncbi:DUF3488 and transglutaminase-like domain-containing protein [Streptomyces thermolineatus]|uniref:DUF3488 and transglutaminase-like domain-containing protein n=1 Tax=Streptomyces thermolineatus TaxID=44033 RepID=A0ABN3MMJ7_9ACTN